MAEGVVGADQPYSGPWGPAADVVMCLLPVVWLLVVTLWKRVELRTSVSLPAAAAMMWFIRLAYLGLDPSFSSAAIVFGVLDALTPLSIIFGAITLFRAMQHTACMPWIMNEIQRITHGHAIAQIFLISWAFSYMLEGTSGFGTPVAMAAPMLISLGHPPLPTIACALIMNTLATQFGAVGTPMWFGFDKLGLTVRDLTAVGFNASLLVAAAAHAVPVIAASHLVSWYDIRRNILFIYLSIWSCVLPAVALSYVTYEFPTLGGGLVGVFVTTALIRSGIGLCDVQPRACDDAVPSSHARDAAAVVPSSMLVKSSHGTVESATLDSAASMHRSMHHSMHCSMHGSNEAEDEDYVISVHDGKFSATQLNEIGAGLDEMCKHSIHASLHGNSRRADGGTAAAADVQLSRRATSDDSEDPSCRTNATMSDVIITEVASSPSSSDMPGTSWRTTVLRTFPVWATVLLLLLTRVKAFELKAVLENKRPCVRLHLGTLGEFQLSSGMVVTLANVLQTPRVWCFETLYVPCFVPFCLIATLTMLLYHKDVPSGVHMWTPFAEAFGRVAEIKTAVIGGMVLVDMLRQAEQPSKAPAYIIGYNLAVALRGGFVAVSPWLAMLVTFFSGSTVSNLTFGLVQLVAANKLGVSATSILALQSVGSTMGNMCFINNIMSAKAVTGQSDVPESRIIAKTAPTVVVFAVIAMIANLPFLFR